MKILIFSQYFYPERFLINEIADELVKGGHEVTVVTGLPNYPSGIIPEEYKHGKRREETIGGVKVIRTPVIARGKNFFKLALNYFSFMFSAHATAKKIKGEYDAVFLYQLTPILQAYPAIKYAKAHNKPLICYCLDLAPASGNGILGKFGFVMKPYTKFSRWAYASCDRIMVTSKRFTEYLEQVHDIDRKIITYVPQHSGKALIEADLTKTEDTGVYDFMFAGNIGKGASLKTIVEAMEKLSKKCDNFRMHFVGDGSYKKTLVEMVEEKGINKYFVFHDPVSADAMPDKYKLADGLIVTLRAGQITVPAKLQAYMSTGKMIFGALDGSGNDMINEAECGICVDAEDAQALADALYDYITNAEKYESCGKNGRAYFKENFTVEKFMHDFNEVLTQTING